MIQCCLCILTFLFPSLRNFYADIAFSENDLIQNYDLIRNHGIAGSGEFLYGIGLVHGMAAFFYITNNKISFKTFVSCLVMLIPCLLDSRTGLMCFLASFLVYSFIKLSTSIKQETFNRLLRISLVVAVLGPILGMLFQKGI